MYVCISVDCLPSWFQLVYSCVICTIRFSFDSFQHLAYVKLIKLTHLLFANLGGFFRWTHYQGNQSIDSNPRHKKAQAGIQDTMCGVSRWLPLLICNWCMPVSQSGVHTQSNAPIVSLNKKCVHHCTVLVGSRKGIVFRELSTFLQNESTEQAHQPNLRRCV